MNLPLADVQTGRPALQAPGMPPSHGNAAHWSVQLQQAASSLSAGDAGCGTRNARSEDRPRLELESCGGPAGPGAAAALQDCVPAVADAPEDDESLPPSEHRERESERAPVRLHLEASAHEGVRVWLGIDGDAALVAQRAGAAIAELRRQLHPVGDGIASLVCNGVPVDARDSSPPLPRKERP